MSGALGAQCGCVNKPTRARIAGSASRSAPRSWLAKLGRYCSLHALADQTILTDDLLVSDETDCSEDALR